MDTAKFEEELNKLVKAVGGSTESSGSERVTLLAKQAKENHKRLQQSVDKLQESLDYLRICIKYQLFDLEATRRENEYLRKILEEKNE